ncbi:MAG: DedA family protein [Candidatus Kaiserbacteria bacterium]|nr:DedA family protein [Candidatus Kaiserbacteria bacterium]
MFDTFFQLPLFSSIIVALAASKYILLFIGTFTEGPLVMMGSGFLLHLGQVEFWPAYLAMVAGDFVADLAWYWIGYFAARSAIERFGHWVGVTPRSIEHMELLFKKYDTKILTISKLTMGFGTGTATLLAAGMLRIPFARYATVNLLAGFAWTLFLMTLGYFFGNLYALIPWSYRVAVMFMTLVLFFFGLRAFSRYVARMVD